MKKQKNTIPSGFEDMLGSIYGNAEGQEEVTKLTDDMASLAKTGIPQKILNFSFPNSESASGVPISRCLSFFIIFLIYHKIS